MSSAFVRPEWATSVDNREIVRERKYIEGPYTDESPNVKKELLYEVFRDIYPGDNHHKEEKCTTTRFQLRSLLTVPSMGLRETKMHNADKKEPIFELVDHAFEDGTNVTYIACSYIVKEPAEAPFLFKTAKYYSDGELTVNGSNHTDRTLMPQAQASGHLSQKDMQRRIDFKSTSAAFLSQFGSSGPQRFDRPQFILPSTT